MRHLCCVRFFWLASLVLALTNVPALSASAIEFLDCSEVNLLGPACEETLGDADTASPPAPPVPNEPLFTLQTMRPDTPPLLVKVFNDPSDANIAAYKAWQHRYLSRTLEVEQRLKEWDRQHPPMQRKEDR